MHEHRRQSIHLPFGTRAIIFDLDETLYDRDTAYAAWATIFVRTCFALEDGTTAKQMIDVLIELDDHEDTPRDLLFSRFLQRYPAPDCSVAALVDQYYSEFPSYLRLEHKVQTLLHTLQAARIPIGIITNGSFRQQKKIEVLGLAPFASCILISSQFGVEKPDPTIFLAAAARLGVPPQEILFVGDNPRNDIWGAHAVGMRTAWLPRARPWPVTLPTTCADLIIPALSDILVPCRGGEPQA